jgi:hypothetical protein
MQEERPERTEEARVERKRIARQLGRDPSERFADVFGRLAALGAVGAR